MEYTMRDQPPPIATDLVLDVREVAQRLKVSTKTVYGLIAAGRLRSKRLGKQRAIRVTQKALEEYLSSEE
jgi:excisionase family DNA binding protein